MITPNNSGGTPPSNKTMRRKMRILSRVFPKAQAFEIAMRAYSLSIASIYGYHPTKRTTAARPDVRGVR